MYLTCIVFQEVTGGHVLLEQGSKPRKRRTRGTGNISSMEKYKEVLTDVEGVELCHKPGGSPVQTQTGRQRAPEGKKQANNR